MDIVTKPHGHHCDVEDCTNKWSAISQVDSQLVYRCMYHWSIYYFNKINTQQVAR